MNIFSFLLRHREDAQRPWRSTPSVFPAKAGILPFLPFRHPVAKRDLLKIPAFAGMTFLLLLSIFAAPARAAEPAAGGACSTAQQFVTSSGPETSGVTSFLVCQGGTWKAIMSANATGEVTKIGNQTCASGDYLKYDGTKIVCTAGTCADMTPNGFTFTDLANVTVSTLTASNIIQVSGFGCVVNTSISGSGSPEYRTCSDSGCSTVIQDWTSSTSEISSGQYIQVRLTTSASGGDTRQATVISGNTASVWSASTDGDCASSPPIGTVCADGTIYAGLTPDGNVPMYVTRCDAGQSWNGAACSGSTFTLTWNDGGNPGTVTGFNNANAGETNTNGLAALANSESPYAAAKNCADLSEGGNSDWYLPSQGETLVMYNNVASIAHFVSGGYWTSTEANANAAILRNMGTGTSGSSFQNKKELYRVRCARK